MVLKKDAILTLLKSIDATMKAAGLELTSPTNPGEDDADIVYEGNSQKVTLKLDGVALAVLCGKNGSDPKTVTQVLFEYEAEDWDAKNTKSVANEVSESVAKYFGTKIVYDNSDVKSKGDKPKSNKAKDDAPVAPAKKASKKDSVVTYEAINLATRMENIYPDLKGQLEVSMNKYDLFLPEEYFDTIMTPRILESIRTEDRATLKKVFNAFNIFYDEGGNDVQSLITVSILGMHIAEEEGLYEKCQSFMDDNLRNAVEPVLKYLKTSSGKRYLSKLKNPQPYKPSPFKRKK